ncbi:hypothetical protein [Lentzea flaviverrucosa]|uniref:Uncharacterized protein n=1 Tax=Lentzea flaviverrucosa TaxID=200379 RepID=A0A1H9T212_9PSEU|nr:hypothetical protein [Lentzea flaviverrucosa]RDI25611.1 hypothetical protein DFR72_108309 [Lentzea flaviverrucosa]SER91117.1 hypothetical protein SAMN05216195_107309 [Lentzea flaviverrucosa]
MAPVEFTVTGGEGSPLDFVAALTPASSLVVITDPAGWAQVSRGLAVGSAASTAVATQVRVLRFAVLDLRHFSSASSLPSLSDVPGDVVALHDTRSWDSAPVVASLRGLGRPVVLFTAVHTWVSGVDTASVVMGWSAPHVVLASPRGPGEARVEDALWQFRELERLGRMTYVSLPAPPVVADRAVTVVVALPGATEGIAGALRPGAEYEVWARVGAHPVVLPADLELRAVLSMSGRPAQSESFVLPAEGPSSWVNFEVMTPYAAVPWTGELVVYHGVVPVHVQQVVLPVGGGEPRSLTRWKLSRTFADLPASRAVSVLDLGDRALVAAGGVPSWTSLAGPALSLPSSSGLDPWYGKDFPAYCADLAFLARQGAAAYSRLFGEHGPAGAVRHAARVTGRPAGLVVAAAASGPVRWPMIYDLPFADGPHRLCPSVGQFGPFGAGGEVPAHCPVPDHNGNVLCPFGFWGLSSVLEHPVGPLVQRILPRSWPFEVAMAVDPGMDRSLTERHVTELMSQVPPESVTSAYVTPAELGRALADEDMDVVHLHFHEGFLDAEEIARWNSEGVWPQPHWPVRKPLIVGTTPMNGLVRSFVEHGASGVISPEVAVPQDMAGWVTGMLLSRLAAGISAGEALRQVRWEMLSRGNVMGLAYALHGSADLRAR